jgi:hypothetical protein
MATAQSTGISEVREPEPFGSALPLSPGANLSYDTYMTKFTDTVSPEAVALTAACKLHTKLLNDDLFMGYDGTKFAFDSLYQELFIIARDEVSLEVEPINQVIETWYDYQYEIMEGNREACWYL